MSYWTYVNGVITVEPLGRTQHEKRYILETILDHLPKVTGSELDMNIAILEKKSGATSGCSCDEFSRPLFRSWEWSKTYECYMLIIDGSFRDRYFGETKRELNKFLNRLAKRVYVNDILVELHGFDYGGYQKKLIISNAEPYKQMEEGPSWWNGESAWAEYLMWDRAPESEYPLKLAYKYYNIPEIDAEIERRRTFDKETNYA